MGFTDKWIEAVTYTAKDKQTDFHWDGSLPGFGLAIYPSGQKSFVLKYRYNGRQRMRTLGRFPVVSVLQARSKAIEQLKALADNVDPIEKEKQSISVTDFCDLYINRWARPRNKGWEKKEKRRNEQYIKREWGNRKWHTITEKDVTALHNKIGIDQDKPYEANRLRRQLSSMFNRAVAWGYFPNTTPNPAKNVQEFPEFSRDEFVTDEMMPELIKATDMEPDLRIRIAVRLYMLTGFRHLELLHIKWEDISFANKYCRIEENKTGKPIYHALPDEALALFLMIDHVDGNPYVFAGKKPGKPLYSLDSQWSRIRARAGYKKLRVHDLRRTTGSWLAIDGFSLKQIGSVLHQSNQHVTNVYARLQLKNTRPMMDHNAKRLTDSWGTVA